MNHLAVTGSSGAGKRVAGSSGYISSWLRTQHPSGLGSLAGAWVSCPAAPAPLRPARWSGSSAQRCRQARCPSPSTSCLPPPLPPAQRCHLIGQPWRKMNAASCFLLMLLWHSGGGNMFPQELAQKIKGYQEQIASLNSKCKMLTMKAKNATMLLTVTGVEGLAGDLDRELLPATSAHPSVVMVSKGQGQVCRRPALSLSLAAPWLLAPGSTLPVYSGLF